MIELQNLAFTYGGTSHAVDNVSLNIGKGEFFALLGPSGCGKSTLLKLLGGYETGASGSIRIDGEEVSHLPPEKRGAAMVFQNYALFPHLNARDNVAFSLRVGGIGKNERHQKADEMLDWIGLSRTEGDRKPSELSGGQQQRVALARALIMKPRLLMLDEPFANLDRLLREKLREELREIQIKAGVTTLLVTHDREEALSLADRIAIMDSGKILQAGNTESVFTHPSSLQVARFLGYRNAFPASDFPFEIPLDKNPGDWLLIRADKVEFSNNGFPATVIRSRFCGTHVATTLRVADQIDLEIIGTTTFPVGEGIGVRFPPQALLIVPPQ